MPGLLIGVVVIILGGIIAGEVSAIGTVVVFAGLALLVGSLYRLHTSRPVPEPTHAEEPIAPQEPGSPERAP